MMNFRRLWLRLLTTPEDAPKMRMALWEHPWITPDLPVARTKYRIDDEEMPKERFLPLWKGPGELRFGAIDFDEIMDNSLSSGVLYDHKLFLEDSARYFTITRSPFTHFCFSTEITREDILNAFREWPFLGANLGKKFQSDYRTHGAGTLGHPQNLIALKGVGHHRIAHRRDLAYGPWRLLRDESCDLSIIQFNDFDADDSTALEQMKPGHLYFCSPAQGLYLDQDYPFQSIKPSFFDKSTRTSIVLVHGDTELPLHAIREAAAIKRQQPFEGITVAQVAFVFFEEANAQKHLHTMWLNGLEVRVMSPTHGQVRIDHEYNPPPPDPPDWVKRLQDREGL